MPLDNEITQKIEGATLNECKEKLFKLYGTNYRILDKKTDFRSSFLGFKQREVQVVTYVVPRKENYTDPYVYTDRKAEEERLEKNRQAFLHAQKDVVMNQKFSEMTNQIEEMKEMLSNVQSTITTSASDVPETISRIEDILAENEFTIPYIRMITEKIRNQFSLDQLEDFKLVQRYVVDWIGESIQIAEEKHVRPPKVVIIVGPTGVGKTTTIAKLASNAILDAKNNGTTKPELCILTIDTMRVGALEQLAKFGEILGKNVLKAENSSDVAEIYEQYKEHVDFMFIDTSGYSPNDSTHISEMKNILDVKMNPQIYLSVCASTKASDLQNIFRNFEPFAYESVIVTKCDESQQIGNIISVLWDRHKSIAYMTDGQRVPRNIKKANIIDILLKLTGFDIDRIHIEDKFGEK